MQFEITEEFVCVMMKQNNVLLEQNKKQSEQISDLINQNKNLSEQVSELTAQIEALTLKIAELTEKNNKNSNNSSKPPSSDGLKKPNKKTSLREKTNRKQGGQKGHEGHNLEITGDPDVTISVIPARCKACPNWNKCQGKACTGEKRYVIDVEIKQTVTEYYSLNVTCPIDNSKLKGEFPESINGRISYGNKISSLLVALNTVGAVSTDRVKEIAGSILNLPISKATIIAMVSRFSKRIQPVLATIKERILKETVVNFDETGSRVCGKTGWIHCAVTCRYTLLGYSQKRGAKGMNEFGVLPFYKGIIQHDCWASYWKYDVKHAVCCAHLLRELNGILENHPEQVWAKHFKILLVNMKKTKDVSIMNGETQASSHYIGMYDKQYAEILKSAYETNPLPEENKSGKRGRKKKGKIRALIERLDKYKGAVCLFFKDFKIAFDNNQAERDLRMIKVKTKVSGCFRSEEGIRDYLAVMSYVSTAKKHGKNAFQAILNVFEGNTFYAIED
jgi:transposase